MADRRQKRWTTVLGMLTICLVLSLCSYGCSAVPPVTDTPSTAPVVSPEIGALAPDFTLPALDGEVLSLSQLRGQPLLLNFWATWCSPCRMELPYIQAAFEERGEEMKFIGIDLGESEDEVRQFAYDSGISFIVVLDTNHEVGRAYNVRYIPTTFFIDGQGVIRDIKMGTFQSEDELIAMVESMLQS